MNGKNKNNNIEDQERITFEQFFSEQDRSTQNYLKEMNELRGKRDIDVDKAWGKLYNRLEKDRLIPDRKNIFLNPAFRIAASIVLLTGMVFTGLYLGTDGFGKNNRTNIISAGADQNNLQIELPDGSTVFLNRNSVIEYPHEFDRDNRNVKLSGEAFFDIRHDVSRPFTIDAGKASINVLGTSFNVNSTDEGVEVLVTTGKVKLSSNKDSRSVILKPGDLGYISDNMITSAVNNDPNYLSWKTQILQFDGDSLAKVFTDLGRVHNINIETEDDDIRQLRITTVYDNQSPETIIRIICTTFNLDYTREGNIYYLNKK